METPILARAVHPYLPQNNDELKLAKDDIITVAQKDDGGWWEGTLNGKSGWFPSNYVVEIDDRNSVDTISVGSTSLSSMEPVNTKRIEYKRMVLDDIIESENAHILELQGMWEHYLQPLRAAEILKPVEYEVLIGNIPEILHFHSTMLHQIKKEKSKQHKEQRVGKIFLDSAMKLESLHKCYCNNHPKAVANIDKYKKPLEEFMEAKGARHPGILVLIVALSQPFRRLEKYPTMLQELERHIEESHKDKGDLQRSIEYYKLIDKGCSVIRKQKEMELEVLNGAIKGWEGSDVTNLGTIHYMNLVHLGPDLKPRYFVLFDNTLLILTYISESNSLLYEGKIPVSGILLTNIADKDDLSNAFEIAGPMLETILVQCSSKESKELWMDHLTRILKQNRFPSFATSPQQSFGQLSPPVQAWNIARLRPAPPFNPFLNESLKNKAKNPNTPSKQEKHTIITSATNSQLVINSSPYGSFCVSPVIKNEEDLAVLSIVDAFCAKTRQISANISSPLVQPQQPKRTSGEKLSRTLTDLVILLSDEVRSLKSAMSKVGTQLEEEQKSRKALQSLITSNLKPCGCTSCQ